MVPPTLRRRPARLAALLCAALALARCGDAAAAHARPAARSALGAPRRPPASRSAVRLADVLVGAEQDMITITPDAMAQLVALKESQGADVLLRMGVRSGGCSGMSYVMDMIGPEQIEAQDLVIDYAEQGLRCVIDPKSSMFLYGLQLDYSSKLIGGGFGFTVRAPPPRARRHARERARAEPAALSLARAPRRRAEPERRVDLRLRLVLQRLTSRARVEWGGRRPPGRSSALRLSLSPSPSSLFSRTVGCLGSTVRE